MFGGFKNLGKSKTTSTLLTTIFCFFVLGLLMVYDSTMFYSQSIYESPYRFAILQLVWVVLGLVGFFIFFNIHYKRLLKVSVLFFGFSVVFLAVLSLFGFLTFQLKLIECSSVFPFVPCINGAYRWFHLNSFPLPAVPLLGVLSFQPSELAKFSIVLYVSAILSKTRDFSKFIFPVGLVFFLILLQPSMSTACLVLLVSLSIYFVSEAPLKPLYFLFPFLLLLISLVVIVSPYRRQRFFTLIDSSESKEESLSTGYHEQQILISLGSGGLFGVGIGQSRQKYRYLPEVASDSIFAIFGEEAGFLGTLVFILAFSFLVYQGYRIALHAPDDFSRLLAVGFTSWIGLQFFINVAAMAQIVPLTGIPIPLVSYGGSSMIFTLCGLGVLANISKYC